MNMIESARVAGFSAALTLATALTASPAFAQEQETAWQKAAAEAVGPLTTELAKAFPGIAQDGKGDFAQFVSALKAAGLGKSQERPAASPGGEAQGKEARGGEGRGGRGGAPDTSAADVEFAASLDANRDGSVTLAEIQSAIETDLRKAFERKASLDTDNDGKVTKKEYATSMPRKFGEVDEFGLDGHARGHFQREDLDQNGELSIEEVAKPVIARLASRIRAMQLSARLVAADADHDKSLSVKELQTGLNSDVNASETYWKTLGLEADALPVENLFRSLSRLSPDDAAKLERSLQK